MTQSAHLTPTQWRESADDANPAGPLFAGGAFAEADIVSAADFPTIGGNPPSICTGSHTIQCC